MTQTQLFQSINYFYPKTIKQSTLTFLSMNPTNEPNQPLPLSITQTTFFHQTNQCFQCHKNLITSTLNFMAEFNTYICKPCYSQQSLQIMEYKMNKPTLYPSIDEIQPGLYLGNEDSASDLVTFKMLGVQAVCVCGDYLLTPYEHLYEYKKYEIADSLEQKIIHLFDENFQWIKKMRLQKKIILIHCAAGVSRSASFVIAYLMKSRNISYFEAFNIVKTKRSIIRPNSGFVRQLHEYQKLLAFSQQVKSEKKTQTKEKM